MILIDAGTTGVEVVNPGTPNVTLVGALSQINDLLAGNLDATVRYFIDGDVPPASAGLTLTANDLGNSGIGGPLTASDTADPKNLESCLSAISEQFRKPAPPQNRPAPERE